MEENVPADSRKLHDRSADEAIDRIRQEDLGVPHIPLIFVEKHHNKTTKLLANSGSDQSIEAKNRWFDYEFSKPLFVGFIDISGSDMSNYDEYQFRAKFEDGRKRDFTGKPKENSIRVDINEYITALSFKPPSVYWSIFKRNPQIQKVSIHGFDKSELGEFLYRISRTTKIKESAIEEISKAKNEANDAILLLTKKQENLTSLELAITESNRTIESLNASISEKQTLEAELQSQLDRSENRLDAINQSIETRKEELSTATKNRETERLEVEKLRTELKKLKDDINLFPSEISGFLTQASKDVQTYIWFVAGMASIIFGLFIWVLNGAFDLSEYVKQNPNVSVWPLLLAKLPLAAVVSALVGASYKIAKVFIEELLKINRQKLSLTQVSIIAKDVSQSSESELNLSDTEIYGLRLRTKMAMLADHIKTFIPTNPTELLPQSIFSRFNRARIKSENGDAELCLENDADN